MSTLDSLKGQRVGLTGLSAESAAIYLDLARLLRYPFEHPGEGARQLADSLQRYPEAAARLQAFHAFAVGQSSTELEEQYARSFDFNPTATMEVGYQLFGESYKRGAFLTRMKDAARSCGLEETEELWDYLPLVLEILARLEATRDPRTLVDEAVLPATVCMLKELGERQYRLLIEAVQIVLKQDFDIPEIQSAPPRDERDFPGPEELWSTQPGGNPCTSARPGGFKAPDQGNPFRS